MSRAALLEAGVGRPRRGIDTMPRASSSARLETAFQSAKVGVVPALYSFIALTFCIDDQNRVLMVQESKPDCRGRYYIPAGRGDAGEDPLRVAWRVTREKAGVEVDPIGIVGIEHNPPIGQFPGQLRVFIVGQWVSGLPKREEDRHSMGAVWVPHADVRGLKLRSEDFLTWLDDLVSGAQPILPTAFWRTLGSPR